MNTMEWGRIGVSVVGMAMVAATLQRMLRVQKVWAKSGRPGMGKDMVVAFMEVMAPKAFANPALPSDARMLLSASAFALFSWAAMLFWTIPEWIAWSDWARGQSPARGMFLPHVLEAVAGSDLRFGSFEDAVYSIASLSSELWLPSIAVMMGRRCETRLAALRELGTPMGDGFARAYEQESGKREAMAEAKSIESALGPVAHAKRSSTSRRL